MEAAFERKKEKYMELTAECREAGCSAVNYPVKGPSRMAKADSFWRPGRPATEQTG